MLKSQVSGKNHQNFWITLKSYKLLRFTQALPASHSKSLLYKFADKIYARFKRILAYLCEREGILYLAREEAYTSQASFPDQDNIPLFKGHDVSLKFPGKRSAAYKGQHRSKGSRGIYVTKDGAAIIADLNGSANIGRKAFPGLFPVGSVCFDNPIIYKHPDCVRQFSAAS